MLLTIDFASENTFEQIKLIKIGCIVAVYGDELVSGAVTVQNSHCWLFKAGCGFS